MTSDIITIMLVITQKKRRYTQSPRINNFELLKKFLNLFYYQILSNARNQVQLALLPRISVLLAQTFKMPIPKQLRICQGYIKLLWVDPVGMRVHIIILIFHKRKPRFSQANEQKVRENINLIFKFQNLKATFYCVQDMAKKR